MRGTEAWWMCLLDVPGGCAGWICRLVLSELSELSELSDAGRTDGRDSFPAEPLGSSCLPLSSSTSLVFASTVLGCAFCRMSYPRIQKILCPHFPGCECGER